jgi:hypothetical protein
MDTGVTTEDAGDGAAPIACTDASVSAATINAGSFACEEAQCTTSLNACAADCLCNNALLQAFQCAADAGDSAAQTNCFTLYLTQAAENGSAAVSPFGICLMGAASSCGISLDGGATTDGGDGAAPVGDGGPVGDADAAP